MVYFLKRIGFWNTFRGGDELKIVALKFGKTEINEGMAFVGGSREKKLPISLLFFLIEQDGKKILVDTGCDTMPGFPLFEHTSPVNILREYGLTPNDITDVILTHSHGDHIGGNGFCCRMVLRQSRKQKAYKRHHLICHHTDQTCLFSNF